MGKTASMDEQYERRQSMPYGEHDRAPEGGAQNDLETARCRYVILHNPRNPRSPHKALDHKTPTDTLRDWQKRQPVLSGRPAARSSEA